VVTSWCESCRERVAAWQYSIRAPGEPEHLVSLCHRCAEQKERLELWPNREVTLCGLLDRVLTGLADTSLTCPTCGLDADDLIRHGRAGCSDCYSAFIGEVEERLSRSVGRTRHRGKNPRVVPG